MIDFCKEVISPVLYTGLLYFYSEGITLDYDLDVLKEELLAEITKIFISGKFLE